MGTKDMIKFIKKLFGYDEPIFVANSVAELDQYLHELTLKQMECDRNGTKPPNLKVLLSKELQELGNDNITALLRSMSWDRAINDPTLKCNRVIRKWR